ncbi:MAG: aminopeptidase [Erysipelotrichaceae bacterium]|jgi:aspartyl aminopeptidase|nr:aminopeptidase [Erysipelotrichaceae bacterium]
MKENAWKKYDEAGKKEVFDFAEGYRNFLSVNKTERECVCASIALAEEKGYRNIEECIQQGVRLHAGDKVYVNNMGKALALFVIGEEPMEKGMRILGAHIDSPRLDIKQNPVYEDTDFALLDTHYYGGIKKYQWVTLPLALHGIVAKKDGTKVSVVIGENEQDPVVGITDLLPHLAADQMKKDGGKIIEGEDLDVLIGSMPLKDTKKESVKAHVMKLIKEHYDIEEDDFLSAEIEVVPAGTARDYGLDRSMIMGYGQDDRVCAYTSLMALLEVEHPSRTCCCILVDKEEIGSVGASGMQSRFFENAIAEIIALCDTESDLKVRRTLQNSHMLSSDVSAAYDPLYAGVMEKRNAAFFGKGMVFNKYTGARGKSGCNDANAEYMAELRRVMDQEHVSFQTAELGKVDQGGGGTIAYILANLNMNVIDSGVPVLSMHAPWEITSKVDVYETYCGYKAFLKHI